MIDENKKPILDLVFSSAKQFSAQKEKINQLFQEWNRVTSEQKMVYGNGTANSNSGVPNVNYFISEILKILSSNNEI